jgi:opacity protein-like surface antigen
MEEKTMRYFLGCLVVALFVLGFGQADAQKMYMGVGGSYTFDAFDQDAIWEGIGADPDELNGSWGASVFFGYGINANMAVQADFAYYFAFSPDEDALEDFELSVWTLMGAVKYGFTPDAKWNPYVIGGLGWGQFDTDGGLMIPDEDGVLEDSLSGLVARVGGGVDYKISEKVCVFAEVGYVFTFGDIEDWNFIDVRAGVGFSF